MPFDANLLIALETRTVCYRRTAISELRDLLQSESRSSLNVWLDPVALARNTGFRRAEINGIIAMVATHRSRLLEAWHEYFG